VLVVSHEALNRHSGTVIALAITSQPQRAGFPLTHPVEGLRLPKASWVKISQIRTLSVERLGRRIGVLNTDEVDHIIEGLVELVG
jgi:mRNA interferase MazF